MGLHVHCQLICMLPLQLLLRIHDLYPVQLIKQPKDGTETINIRPIHKLMFPWKKVHQQQTSLGQWISKTCYLLGEQQMQMPLKWFHQLQRKKINQQKPQTDIRFYFQINKL